MYVITLGSDADALGQRRESATEALELIRELAAKGVAIVKVTDRDGMPLTIEQLERLSDKENI